MAALIRYISILILNFALTEVSFALAYNIIPKAGTTLPKAVLLGTTQTAFYTVTNNTKTTLTNGFVKYLPQHVKQITKNAAYPDLCGAQFTLRPKKSCTLQLTIRGEVKASNPDPKQHLFICTPHVLACAGTPYPLNVTAIVPTVSGTVQSGGSDTQVIADAVVKIYRAEQGTAKLIGSATTNSMGKFYLYIPLASILANKTYYAVANKNTKINLMTVMGDKPLSTIVLNELTTVAAAYSMAQFIHENLIYGQALGLKIAAMMNANLVNPSNGNLSPVITTSPNANETNAMRALNSLANALVPCIRNTTYCPALFTATTFGNAPTNTLEAVLSIAHHPSNNVLGVYALGQAIKLYTPYLSSLQKPNAWTIAVKFNNTGSETCPFGGPAKVRFDKNGSLWITNNVIQGTPNSTNCIVVLQPNGQPANGKNNTPISPVFGGGLLGTAYGIDIDQNDSVWVGDFGWGQCTGCIPSTGAVSQLHLNGTPISGSSGYSSYIYRAQGVVADKNNNIWIASYGNDRIVVFPKGNPNEAFYYQEPANSGPFDIVLDSDGAAWVSNSGSAIVNKFIIQNNQIVNALSVPVGNQLKGITIDSQNNLWLASFGDNTVYELDPSGTIIHTVNGVGGIEAPWGVRVDSGDNVWVANFTDFLTVNHYSISEICGSKPSNCPPGLTTGDAITPVSGYTLPTGGSQVLLANGTPLNGPHGPPSYFPLMRLTQVIPDRAGNIWAANNWKPIPFSSHFANPGGDGMVAFIGLGKPTEDVQ